MVADDIRYITLSRNSHFRSFRTMAYTRVSQISNSPKTFGVIFTRRKTTYLKTCSVVAPIIFHM